MPKGPRNGKLHVATQRTHPSTTDEGLGAPNTHARLPATTSVRAVIPKHAPCIIRGDIGQHFVDLGPPCSLLRLAFLRCNRGFLELLCHRLDGLWRCSRGTAVAMAETETSVHLPTVPSHAHAGHKACAVPHQHLWRELRVPAGSQLGLPWALARRAARRSQELEPPLLTVVLLPVARLAQARGRVRLPVLGLDSAQVQEPRA